MALDENYRDWKLPDLSVPPDRLSAFRGERRRIELRPGQRICRLRTAAESMQDRSNMPGVLASPWWFSEDTLETIVWMAEAKAQSITTRARIGLAVPTRFNKQLDTLMVFSLLASGYAIEGEAAPQRIFEDGLPVLPGGLIQLYVPGLTAKDVRFENYGSVKGF